jgi:hypothetical protein
MRGHADLLARALFVAASLASAWSCSGGATTAPGSTAATKSADSDPAPENTGSVALELDTGGSGLDVVQYVISDGTPSHTYSGDFQVGDASVLMKAVGGIAAGDGYQLILHATEADGITPCSGHAGPFTVVAHTSVAVAVTLTCKRPATTGSVVINGTTNLCAQIDSITANTAVPGAVTLHAEVTDEDNGPEPIAYTWTTDGGHLDGATTADATLTCVDNVPVTVTATVTDGDPAPGCADTFSFTVDCHVAGDTGTVIIDAPTTNSCPVIESVTADPPLGATIALNGTASDAEGDALSYAWTTDWGTLLNAASPNATLVCSAPGPASLTLTVSDGTDPLACSDSFGLTVSCP